jgi:hypothetical protein
MLFSGAKTPDTAGTLGAIGLKWLKNIKKQ